jgi:hypothetical protein
VSAIEPQPRQAQSIRSLEHEHVGAVHPENCMRPETDRLPWIPVHNELDGGTSLVKKVATDLLEIYVSQFRTRDHLSTAFHRMTGFNFSLFADMYITICALLICDSKEYLVPGM